MTKEHLAEELYKTVVENNIINLSKKEIIEMILGYLSVLEPRDKEKFASWGYPHQKSTLEDCWK